jgi:hypothetical protein
MDKVLSAILWLFSPTVQMWREMRERSATARPLPRLLWLASTITRMLLVAAVIWALWTGRWALAAGVIGILVVLGLIRWAGTRWAIKRWGGRK